MKKILFLLLLLPILGSAQVFSVAPFADTPPGPFMTFLPTGLVGFTSSAGTRGTSQSYVASWNQWQATADTVTAPTGYVVSVDNTTFVTSLFFSTPGLTGNQTVYVALAASNTPQTYTGNVAHKAGAVTGNVSVAGTTAGVPAMSVSPTSLSLTDTAGTPGTPGTLTNTFAYLSGSVAATIPTATIPLEMSIDGGITWASSQSYSTGSPLPVKVRVTSSASNGTAVDTVQFAATGVTTIKIPVTAVVTSPSVVKVDTLVIPTSVTSATVANFPIVFNKTATQFKTTANGGSVANANGYDITFSRDAAGSSLLKWEMETYVGSTGQVVAHILTDSVSSHKNDTIYMRYNQSSITTFQGGAAGAVWTGAGNYTGVYHMNDVLTAAGQHVLDWTSNARQYTSVGTWTSAQTQAGPVGNALQTLKSNGDYLNITGTEPDLSGDFTIEGWVNITVADNTCFLWGATAYANDVNWYSAVGHLYTGGGDLISTNGTISINTWRHMVITRHFDGTNYNFVWYYNGAQDNTAVVTSGNNGGFVFNFPSLFYNLNTNSNNMLADEVRFSTVARSGVWVADEYLNQFTPDSFYAYKQGH